MRKQNAMSTPQHWHYATITLVPEDARAESMMSEETTLDRDQAHAKIQDMLDRLPELAQLADTWRRGAKDDWVTWGGLLNFTIFECSPHGCATATQALLDDYAATLRAAGVPNVNVVRIPDTW
jgi:hypothetical protein